MKTPLHDLVIKIACAFQVRPGYPPLLFRVVASLPLFVAFRISLLLACVVRVAIGSRIPNRDEQIELLSNFNGTQQSTDCYARSLFNSYRLHLLSRPFCFWVGVFPPTNLMHCWVTIENCAVGEHPDELMHFQPAICFSVGCDAISNK